nr:immunoglobulin light chain junction region [Macaca mulatta]MPO04198.1 immunoglobulin light chain junction region [Macaca mulatta]MPO04599.1 immunoglobulin light chain junction region [Macaca mulatta]MPO04909.1 immunoglobulin light chain junction region [Macaca mulatta]MPO04926.1 immunoglobulin light chain junction region [Macaca mulatta]
CSSYVDSNVLF